MDISTQLWELMSSVAPHAWEVYTTFVGEGFLGVRCRNSNCGAYGYVSDPSSEEWSAAFRAPSKPYLWEESSRVTLQHGAGFCPGCDDDEA